MSRWPAVAIGVALSLCVGCEQRSSTSGQATAENALAQMRFFVENPVSLAGDLCPARVKDAPTGTELQGAELSLHLFLGAGVDAAELRAETLAAQAYFARYGLTLRKLAVTELSMEVAIAGRHRSGERAAGSQALAPMRAFLAEHAALDPQRSARPRSTGHVNVVLLPRIVRPDSPIARYLQDVAGLAISPQRSADPRLDAGVAALLELLEIERFVPTVFLSRRDLARLHPQHRQTTLAHELGHALNLVHSDARADLMAPDRRTDCVPRLSGRELTDIRAALAALVSPRSRR